jgi:hypothetical protein
MRVLALLLFLGLLTPAAAQAPPAVPALPDTQRLTQYSITSSLCTCAVNFAIYGDGTDVDNWLQVFINGVGYLSTDPQFGWSLSSPTGPIGSIARPITDAVLNFTFTQTGTVLIVGARRPRALSQFPENRGVAARDLNQRFTDMTAIDRELWDKFGRALLALPGNTVGNLPLPSNCIGLYINLGADGKTPTCLAGISQPFSIIVLVRSSSSATVTVSSSTDYFLCLDTTSNAIAVNLPASPNLGLTYLIKDCTGQAPVHNITITPAAGLIDNSSNFVISLAHQSIGVTYTGAQWSIN